MKARFGDERRTAIPKRLRLFFRFDRGLLGELPRLAWQTVLGPRAKGPGVLPRGRIV